MTGADALIFVQAAPASTTPPTGTTIDEQALQTYGGASAAVWFLYTTFRMLSKRDSLPVAFVLSLTVSLIVTFSINGRKPTELVAWFVALLNGCVMFCAASGVQETFRGAAQAQQGALRPNRATVPKFLDSWFPSSASKSSS